MSLISHTGPVIDDFNVESPQMFAPFPFSVEHYLESTLTRG